MPEFTLTLHAESVMMERGIPVEWVGRVLASPTRLVLSEHCTLSSRYGLL